MRERTLDDKVLAALQPSVSVDLPPTPPVEVLPPDASLPPLPPNETSAASNANSKDPACNDLAVSSSSSSSRCSPLQASQVSSKKDALCVGSEQLSLEPRPPSWAAMRRPSDAGSLEVSRERPLIVEARPPTRQSSISAPRVSASDVERASTTTGEVVQQEDGDRLRLGYKSFVHSSHPQRDQSAIPSIEDDSLLTSSLEQQPVSQPVDPSSARNNVSEQTDVALHENYEDRTKQRTACAVALNMPEQLRLSLSTGADLNPRMASPATDEEELVLDGSDSVLANTIRDLGDDPVLRAHQQIVKEEKCGVLSTTLQGDDDVLAAAAMVDLKAAVAKYDAKNATDAETTQKQRPTGWAATFDIASSGDVFATREAVPHPPALRSATDRDTGLEKMQRFNMMRAKKTRAMAERRRLEKEHRAALRAGAFGVDEDDENNGDLAPQAPNAVKAAIRRASTQKLGSTRPLPTTRSMSNRRNISNVRCGAYFVFIFVAQALVQVCLAGPHCATMLADALASLERAHVDNYVIVLKDGSHTFRGLYALQRGRAATNSGGPYVDAEKIFGRGPARFGEATVASFLKYNSASRAFTALPAKSFTLTTDAVVLQNTQFKARPLPTY